MSSTSPSLQLATPTSKIFIPNGSFTAMVSSSIYVYTFLSILLVLIAVTGITIFRARIIRRRFRLMRDISISNGTWIPPIHQRTVIRRPEDKPKIHDVYVDVVDWEGNDLHDSLRDKRWMSLMPLHACYSYPLKTSPTQPSSRQEQDEPSRKRPLLDVLLCLGTDPMLDEMHDNRPPAPSTQPEYLSQPDKAHVSFLVSMPSQGTADHRTTRALPGEPPNKREHLPELQIAVMDMPVIHKSDVDGGVMEDSGARGSARS